MKKIQMIIDKILLVVKEVDLVVEVVVEVEVQV